MPANSDPFASARISPTVLFSNVSRATELASLRLLARPLSSNCRIITQNSLANALSMGRTARQSNVLPRREFLNEQGLIFGACYQSTAVVPDGTPPNPLEVLRGAFDGLSGRIPAMA